MKSKIICLVIILIVLNSACAPKTSSEAVIIQEPEANLTILPTTIPDIQTLPPISTSTPEPTLTFTPSATAHTFPDPLNITQYTAVAGDTCASIAAAHKIILNELLLANPFLYCSSLKPGREIVIVPPGTKVIQYLVAEGETCMDVAEKLDINPLTIQRLNPDVDEYGKCNLQDYKTVIVPQSAMVNADTSRFKPVTTSAIPTLQPGAVPYTTARPPAVNTAPKPTALCKDGTYSYSQTRSGTCSHHGGVAQWLQN